MTVFYSITNRLSLIVFMILFFTAGVCATDDLPQTNTIEVMGTAIVRGGDVVNAKKNAIIDGKTTAVSQIVSDLLPVDTIVKNFDVFNELFFKDTDKFIEGYKELVATVHGKYYRVIVQAVVSVSKIKEQLSNIGIMSDKKDVPNVLFMIAEKDFATGIKKYWWKEEIFPIYNTTEKSMAAVMHKKGITVIDHGNIDLFSGNEISGNGILLPKSDIDNLEAVNIGISLKADVVIVGEAFADRAPNTMGTDIRTFKGTIVLRVLRVDTGEEIASLIRSDVSVDIDEYTGALKALSGAGSLAAEELVPKIISSWQKEEDESSMLEINVEGISNLPNFVRFRKIVTGIPEINGLHVREIKSNTAVIAIDFKGSAREFADILMTNTFETFSINIPEVAQKKLKVVLVP
ncbi:MAG: hypothetical protein HN737_00075 [Desulfobacterales bacterium]|jgi:hypothetical protein|nr:hypothetical protein [Desulfobacteraceae bacterium]MBT4364591.1 hypothetical protein [Desulfobacteraceae bacterium]MBT7087145.1 hypothetical protein [Desulfobacterales bacterium]MBT7695786.1 hypothetical protein [Desulfobacterales bacterium]